MYLRGCYRRKDRKRHAYWALAESYRTALVCFLAYALWKTMARLCQQAGLGAEPRKVFAELQGKNLPPQLRKLG
jgi:hypothetical protein